MGNLQLTECPPKAHIFLSVHIYSEYTYLLPHQELGHFRLSPIQSIKSKTHSTIKILF